MAVSARHTFKVALYLNTSLYEWKNVESGFKQQTNKHTNKQNTNKQHTYKQNTTNNIQLNNIQTNNIQTNNKQTIYKQINSNILRWI